MSAEETYEPLDELVARIGEQLKALESGRLHVGELDHLTNGARELYERLIVLRYRAFDAGVQRESETDQAADGFRISVTDGQISLIDAIQEMESGQPEASAAADFALGEPEEEGPGLPTGHASEGNATEHVLEEEDLLSTAPSAPEPGTNPESISPTEPLTPDPEPTPVPDTVPEPIPEAAQPHSINDRLADAADSIASKMERAPLEQLRGSISLNQKFQLINDVFDGDNAAFEHVLGALDNAGSRNKALETIGALQADPETPGMQLLLELITRRYG